MTRITVHVCVLPRAIRILDHIFITFVDEYAAITAELIYYCQHCSRHYFCVKCCFWVSPFLICPRAFTSIYPATWRISILGFIHNLYLYRHHISNTWPGLTSPNQSCRLYIGKDIIHFRIYLNGCNQKFIEIYKMICYITWAVEGHPKIM